MKLMLTNHMEWHTSHMKDELLDTEIERRRELQRRRALHLADANANIDELMSRMSRISCASCGQKSGSHRGSFGIAVVDVRLRNSLINTELAPSPNCLRGLPRPLEQV